MACLSLSKSYKLGCIGEASQGGIAAIGMAVFEYGEIISRPTQGILEALPTSVTDIYRYEMKNTGNSFSEVSSVDANTRTNTYTGTLTAILNTLEPELMDELYNLSKGEVYLFCELNSGQIVLLGAKNGSLASVTTNSGTDTASGQNASIQFNSVEPFPFLTLSSTAVADYKSKVVAVA